MGVKPRDLQFNKYLQQIFSKMPTSKICSRMSLFGGELSPQKRFGKWRPIAVQILKESRKSMTDANPIQVFLRVSEVTSKSSKQMETFQTEQESLSLHTRMGSSHPSGSVVFWHWGCEFLPSETFLSLSWSCFRPTSLPVDLGRQSVSLSYYVFRYLLVSFSQVLSLKWKHPEDFKFGLKWFLRRRQKRARRVCSFALPLRGVFTLFTGFTKNRSCWAIYWNRTASFHFFFPFLLLSLLSLSPSLSSFLSFFFSPGEYSLSFIKHLLWGIHCITHCEIKSQIHDWCWYYSFIVLF